MKSNYQDEDFILVPKYPSFAMLDAGWGICGTRLSEMEPNPGKIESAQQAYAAMLKAADRALDIELRKMRNEN